MTKKLDFIEENTAKKDLKIDKIVLRVTPQMKTTYYNLCEKYGYNSAAILRNFILNFIKENTKKEEN